MAVSSTRAVQLALHIVPGSAVVVAAVLALLTRTPKPIGARVYGGPPGPDGVLAWRVVVLERDHGYFSPVPSAQLHMSATAGAQSVSCDGTTDADGAWEARLPVPAPDASEVQLLVRAEGLEHPIVEGAAAVRPRQWEDSFKRLPVRVAGRSDGPLTIKLSLLRGGMAAGFPEDAVVTVGASESREAVPQARVRVGGEGFSIEPDGDLLTDARGEVRVRILPAHHSPTVEIKATSSAGLEGTWEGALPVTPGSMWVDPDALAQGRLLVRSPVSHHMAYLTFFDEHARLFATQLRLLPDPSGGASGEIPFPPLPVKQVWVLTSPDPQGQGTEGEQVAWPASTLRSDDPRPSPGAMVRTPLLADGIPAAVLAVRTLTLAARARILFLLAAAAIAEAVLLFVRARQSRRELVAILASEADVDEALLHTITGGERFWIKLVIAAVLIAAGLGAVALVLWMQV